MKLRRVPHYRVNVRLPGCAARKVGVGERSRAGRGALSTKQGCGLRHRRRSECWLLSSVFILSLCGIQAQRRSRLVEVIYSACGRSEYI